MTHGVYGALGFPAGLPMTGVLTALRRAKMFWKHAGAI